VTGGPVPPPAAVPGQ